MSYFYPYEDKDAVKAFVYEDLKNLGIKVPKLEKLSKAHRNSISQNSTGGAAVFGVPLPLIPAIEDENIGYIPKFLVHTRSYLSSHLHKEGLFRKTGSVARQKDLAQHIENHGGEHLEDAQVYDVTSVVKQFFRELPEPLIPHILQEGFVKCVQLNTADSKAYAVALISLLLPSEHLSVFRYMLEVLYEITQRSSENKMDAHNLAVCLTPNFFQTKQTSKHISEQTEAVELCIRHVSTIGVIPPSITERVVMLRSLEGATDHIGGSNSSIDCSTTSAGSSSGSTRKKKRSGSIHGYDSKGLVGSIRRSVDRLMSRTSRRSVSVPESLNAMNDSDDYDGAPDVPQAMSYDSDCVTPQIVRKASGSHVPAAADSVGISASRRRAIINRSGLLVTPFSGLPPTGRTPSCDNVFHSPPAQSHTANQTSISLNSTNNTSRVGTPNGKKSGWAILRSPFSKRKRSLSAGPTLSPASSPTRPGGRGRTSSRTKKLIRRLSGGKARAQDVIGHRLAYSAANLNACAASMSGRQRMPSSPAAIHTSPDDESSLTPELITNEQLMRNLQRDLESSDRTSPSAVVSERSAADDLVVPTADQTADAVAATHVSRIHTMREERRAQTIVRRRRAKSADSRPLKRGRPNHPTTGLARVRMPSHDSQQNQDGEDHWQDIVPQPNVQCESKKSEGLSEGLVNGCQRIHISNPLVSSQLRPPVQLINLSAARLTRSDQGAVTATAAPTDELAEVAGNSDHIGRDSADMPTQRRACKRRADSLSIKPPIPSKRPTAESCQLTDVTVHEVRGQADGGYRTATAVADDVTSSSNGDLVSSRSRFVIGGNDQSQSSCQPAAVSAVVTSDLSDSTDVTDSRVRCQQPLAVRGASLQKAHHDSILNLNEAHKVNQVKKTFDRQPSDERVNACKPPSAAAPLRTNCPVRIPTVFAKDDPRAMRYKMAADAVRKRHLQRQSADGSENGTENGADDPPVCSPVSSYPLRSHVINKSSHQHVRSPVRRTVKSPRSPSARSTSAAAARRAMSLRTPNSPPVLITGRVSRRASRAAAVVTSRRQAGSGAAPCIPISTELVRGAQLHQMADCSKTPATPVREMLREKSPNVFHQPLPPASAGSAGHPAAPRIKPPMIPLDNIKTPSKCVSSLGRPFPKSCQGQLSP